MAVEREERAQILIRVPQDFKAALESLVESINAARTPGTPELSMNDYIMGRLAIGEMVALNGYHRERRFGKKAKPGKRVRK
jgi:hypothetical protein